MNTKPLSKNPLYELCRNPDCVGGRDVEENETCEACDGEEYVRKQSDCLKCGEACDIEESLCGDCEEGERAAELRADAYAHDAYDRAGGR